MKKEIKVTNRKSTFVELKDYCIGSMVKDGIDKGHFLEVTEWSNGEGYDIHILDYEGERQIQLSWGQFEAMKKCIKAIDKTSHTK
jgi:hypothetical protein|tara:strand:+ start:1077 stop:1331 length:255 start_codon:yes stop_codon:yes gene_type:complete